MQFILIIKAVYKKHIFMYNLVLSVPLCFLKINNLLLLLLLSLIYLSFIYVEAHTDSIFAVPINPDNRLTFIR